MRCFGYMDLTPDRLKHVKCARSITEAHERLQQIGILQARIEALETIIMDRVQQERSSHSDSE